MLFCQILVILCLFKVNLFAQYVDANKNGKMDIYENPKADIEERIEDLLSRMTLEEKVAGAIAKETRSRGSNLALTPNIDLAIESIILLKNENKILPIDLNKIKTLAVIGPNAKQVHFGGYSTRLSQKRGVTVYDGIKKYAGDKVALKYAEGCKIHLGDGHWRSPEAELNSQVSDLKMINEAVEVAKESDVVILAIGGTPRICRENFG